MSGTIAYNNSLVSFFDILGFKNIVEGNKEAAHIFNIVSHFKRHSSPDEELASLFKLKFTLFSDTVVRSVNLFPKENKEYPAEILFHELIDLIHIQCSLLHKNILIRGALSIGKIFHQDDIIFGPALNEAYTLENNKARFPRIIFKKSLIDKMSDIFFPNPGEDERGSNKEFILSMLREGKDNIYFLDYLRFICEEMDTPNDYLNFLTHHKKLILDNYSDTLDSKTKCKYIWLCEYHNDVVEFMSDALSSFGFDVEKLLISNKKVPVKGLFYKEGNEIWRKQA